MGCGASVEDSDSQASLEDWERMHRQRDGQKEIPNDVRRRQSAVSEDASEDLSEATPVHEKDEFGRARKLQTSEYQGSSVAVVGDMLPPYTSESNYTAPSEEGLFVDGDFPPSETTLYHSKQANDPKIVWLRPHELTERPELLVDGVSRHDIVQGLLADCWFLSSCAAVAQRPDLMEKVIPAKQRLSGDGYKGVVTFRFWRFGHWVTVYVDDLLPTKKNKLIYSRSAEPREFWVSLLEKAYAKLHGSYEALEGGQSMDALVDLTGGLAEMYVLESAPPHLYNYLLQASYNGAFITCSRKGNWMESVKTDPNGLVSGHAYTISAVATVKLSTGSEASLIRVRNPWGTDTEWSGEWSDNDKKWLNIDSSTKKMMEYSKRGDGEFWISYQDFCREFEELTICSINPDLAYSGNWKNDKNLNDKKRATVMKYINGRWEEGKSCGGSRNNLVSFAKNPQFLLTVSKQSNANRESDKKFHIVVALMQLRRRCVRHQGRKMLQIAFVVFKVDNPVKQTLQNFHHLEEVGNSGAYVNYREVFGRFELWPGYYVIVPATFEPEAPGSFYIRVYADTHITLKEL